MYDLIINNAKICDGTGDPAFIGSVAVTNGKVVTVGEVTGGARETVDATGLVLAPGFIDQHTHFDAQLLWDGLCEPSLEHGVTTIMPGNCSLSFAPLRPEDRDYVANTFVRIEEMPRAALDAGVQWNWQTFDEYVTEIKKNLGINVAPVVGHSMLRLWVLGQEARRRKSTPEELVKLQEALRECLRAGAIGMSTSWLDIDDDLRPVPCRMGEPAELDALCSVLGEFGGVLQALPEFFEIDKLWTRIDILGGLSRKYGITTTFSPLFDSNVHPDLVQQALDRVRIQNALGANVVPQMQVRAIDMAFEITTPGSITARMPSWWKMAVAGPDEIKRQLRDPVARAQLVREGLELKPGGHLAINFNEATVKRANLPEHQSLIGRKLKDIAAERGTNCFEVMFDIALAEDLDASFGMSAMGHNAEDKIGVFLADKNISIGAGDGGAHLSRFSTYGDTGHLFERYVRKENGMPLEEAVRKLTREIAQHWGLKDRGTLRAGFAADMVLFDENSIDRGPEYPEYDLPGGKGFRYMRRAVGIKKVWVNGQLAYDGEQGYTDTRAGAITERAGKRRLPAEVEEPAPIRKWTYPMPGDDWPTLAARTLPDRPLEEAIEELQSWNASLVFRNAPAEIVPTDILFLEPPLN